MFFRRLTESPLRDFDGCINTWFLTLVSSWRVFSYFVSFFCRQRQRTSNVTHDIRDGFTPEQRRSGERDVLIITAIEARGSCADGRSARCPEAVFNYVRRRGDGRRSARQTAVSRAR